MYRLPAPGLLVDTEHLPGAAAEDHPLAGHGAHHDHLDSRYVDIIYVDMQTFLQIGCSVHMLTTTFH